MGVIGRRIRSFGRRLTGGTKEVLQRIQNGARIPANLQHRLNEVVEKINRLTGNTRREALDQIDNLFTRFGRARTMQEHHWIEQHMLNRFQFLRDLQQNGFDIIRNRKNLSLKGGHVGRHRKAYDRRLEDLLRIVQHRIDNGQLRSNRVIRREVIKIIRNMKRTVKNTPRIMNRRRLFILE